MQQLLQSQETDSKVDLSRSADDFDSLLYCGRCGERFQESEATEDGWYYRCPNEDCDAEGIHEDLYPVKDVLPSTH
ncbi:zinc ribbon domain-containing protein [Halorussus halophilus]|uniref:zinc ribbon domain-containing protein n=1 Tax=Halorussus halophilus TaxID=2650975 RepID=UPI001CE4891D|nr:zinc ribbon domain-containing protein [Halorussus halophilus]